MRKAKYYIYRNLHKNCFSVKYKGKVIKHSTCLILENCTFIVNQKGQERVLKEKRKNVHAYIAAENFKECDKNFNNENSLKKIYYNPYNTSSFIFEENLKTITTSKKILAKNNNIYLLEK